MQPLLRLLHRHARWAARVVWSVTFAIVTGLFLVKRWDTPPYTTYAGAGQRFLAHAPLYDLTNIDGFQYFPHAALIFAPFAWLGSPAGDVTWRAIGWLACAFGMLRLAQRLSPRQRDETFFLATALAMGPAVANLVNGQANLVLAALSLHVAVELIDRRFWRAALLLAFGVALKPLMVVPLLLVWTLYPAMVLRVPVALLGALAMPWLFRDHAYVTAQLRDCLVKLKLCANPDRRFEDLRGLLDTVGLALSPTTHFVLRALAAGGTWGLCLRARRTLPELDAAFFVTAFAMAYLMLFNPRTLTSSYVMVGCLGALLAALYIQQRRQGAMLIMGAILLAWTINYNVVPFVAYWLRPLATLVFCGVLVRELYAQQGQGVLSSARAC